ncbi:hypothetical protein FGK63_18765 [Ruegeria sediminis]|uniref:Metallo-beta-lactamase domain-containing protein n=1 Tax=Ruegeria sediminis TaxID=2583820 RepID=A0ABY2WTJ3_9RHOB|nr:hypothetical protein [Ruegeria sediminis]TMV03712.1 hypothetical protein FGK63_18765 [Ruegeria sediminis]
MLGAIQQMEDFSMILRTLVSLFLIAAGTAAVAQDAQREIIPVKGDVYLFRNNFHQSLIVATPVGTVRVDPINAEASAWLNENLGEITDQPVTHLIYSHSHLDHASGGSAHEGAQVIAHQNAPEAIDGVAPDLRVGDSHMLELGGKTIELTYLGPGHGEDMLAVVVRPENVGFIVDVAAPKRLPYRNMGGANLDDWIGQIKNAMALDFEVFAPGHGPIGTHDDLAEHLGYFEALRAGVLEGLEAGKSVEEIQAELTLDDYKDWLQYEDWRALNIEGMASYLTSAGIAN